jgi:hypothetical protein
MLCCYFFQAPILVYIPIVCNNKTLVPTIKYYKDGRWAASEPAPPIEMPNATVSLSIYMDHLQ